MPKLPTTNRKPKRRPGGPQNSSEDQPIPKPTRGRKSKATAESAGPKTTEEDLNKVNAENRQLFGLSNKTTTAYDGYMDRARKHLAEVVQDRREKGIVACALGYDTELLASSLEGPPNKLSAYAIELYITKKCFAENCGKSTAEGVHGAFCNYYDGLDKYGKYTGEYYCNEITGEVSGNPARARQITTLVTAVKTRAKVKGADATRRHATPLTMEDLIAIVRYSESINPPSDIDYFPSEMKDFQTFFINLMLKTMVKTGFCLWTRIFELCHLQAGDIELDRQGRAPHYFPFHRIVLQERKGWQHEQGWDGPRERNTYEIYEEEDIPEADVYHPLKNWIRFLETRLGRKLQTNEYIFPNLSGKNGTFDPSTLVRQEVIQKWLNELATAAGIKKYYTMHCLRRGGAQYRFEKAPIGKRWSLSTVRWWGGWCEGENVETLMKYLLDSLQSYERSHSDAMCPIPREAERSFMGEHKLLEPVTHLVMQGEMQSLAFQINDRIDTNNKELTQRQDRTEKQIQEVLRRLPTSNLPLSSAAIPVANFTQSRPAVFNCAQQIFSGENYNQPAFPPTEYWTGEYQRPNFNGFDFFIPDFSQFNAFIDSMNSSSPAVSESQSAKNWKPVPIAGVTSLPQLPRGANGWREAIRQWDEIIKNWPKEYHQQLGTALPLSM